MEEISKRANLGQLLFGEKFPAAAVADNDEDDWQVCRYHERPNLYVQQSG